MDSEISKKKRRFEKINNDPKFKPIPKKVHKVELNDNRFNAMFSNKDFYSKTKIDKYGRKIKKKEEKNIMDDYYIRKEKKKEKKEKKEKEDIENKEKEEEEESDTSEEFQEFLDNMNKNMEEAQKEENEEKIPMGQETSRIAIQNIDWTNIHALDLYVLLNSFCKGSQKVLKVEIYPSEYGMKEMAKENEQGPDKEIFNTEAIVKTGEEKEEEEEDDDDDEINSSNEGFDPVELRKYELKKLKYYYAIAYCDSVETANMLYNECDGLEIERTQSFMDMRFVPDELKEFPYKPKEVCDHMPANKEYNQEFRPNSALQDTKVKLTWDQGDQKRQDLLYRAFHKEGFNEDDINELLVSSDSEEDSDVINGLVGDDNDEENEDNKMQLNLLKKKRKMPKFKDGETIEIKFNKGFEGINPKVLNENEDKKENKTKWEQFKEKKKNKRKEKKREEREKKKKRKEKINNEYNSEEEEENKKADKNELNLLVDEQIKNKKKFKYNEKDERFQTNNNTDFAIDPTNKNYKKIKDKKIL